METPTIETEAYAYGTPKCVGHRMAKSDFLRWESDDNYVYEYSDGILEPTTSIRQDESLLLKRLTRRVQTTTAYQQEGE